MPRHPLLTALAVDLPGALGRARDAPAAPVLTSGYGPAGTGGGGGPPSSHPRTQHRPVGHARVGYDHSSGVQTDAHRPHIDRHSSIPLAPQHTWAPHWIDSIGVSPSAQRSSHLPPASVQSSGSMQHFSRPHSVATIESSGGGHSVAHVPRKSVQSP